jgi:predicted Zn-dependent protease
MTRWIALTVIVLLGVAAVVVSERRKVEASASPEAILYLVADTEKELTRMPVRFTRMSDADEIRIGDELASFYALGQQQENQQTSVVEKYLNQVGAPLASRAHRKLPYKFHYIPSSYFINAFALPGGHIYVGGGLLALMDSEDELASVLGHEIEHVDHYHCAERAQQEEALRRIPFGGLVAIPMEVFEAGYSKDQELEADREGVRLAVEAGYSANGAIRMFETFERLFREYQARAKTPQQELTQVALQTLEGYFRSHPLPSERIAQVHKMIASEGWPTRSERDLAVAYIFWTQRALEALQAKNYPLAQQLAARSLKLQTGQPEAEEVLAQAQFAQADFAGAAESYRKMLGNSASNSVLTEGYALALAAADRHQAVAEFRRWVGAIKGEKSRDVDVELAGLELLGGDSAPAHRLEIELRRGLEDRGPILIGELGWWYYLAGNYENAADLLGIATQLRPGDMRLWVEYIWTEIEIRRFSDAIQSVNNGSYEERRQPERQMAEGVAFWQARQPDQALADFAGATTQQPEWENPRWVRGLYSPLVEQSVLEMKAERERRRKQRMAANR